MPASVICLMGPTAAGKTDLAVELVQRYPLEIISVDSAQVYRQMDIGSAKPDAATLARAPHRLIDFRDPSEPYSAALFCEDAMRHIDEIHGDGRIPFLVGGTMLYFRALLQGMSDLPEADPVVRAQLLLEAEEQGWHALHAQLADIDPQAAERIHPNDPQRLQRALEIYRITGKTLTELHAEAVPGLEAKFNVFKIALIPEDRKVLHARIEQRFRQMVNDGLLEEVKHLFERSDLNDSLPSIRSVGYRQVWQYLAGELEFDEMIERGVIATRQLAKRQLTWLRNDQHHITVSDAKNLDEQSARMTRINKNFREFQKEYGIFP